MHALERAWREERAAVTATVARRLGDLQLAEDAVQEAFAAAAERWPVDGVPRRPGAWLTTTAWRRALDAVRRDRRLVGGHELADGPAAEPPDEPPLPVDDDLLALVLTCCHPALDERAQVSLTLRHVAGLPVPAIAAGLLEDPAATAKRLVRARAKIRDARIPFGTPGRADLAARLDAVRAVVYLVFTEGHLAAGDGPPVRVDLCEEAVWLARQLHRLVPEDAETTGLLALLLLQHARSAARVDGGRLLPLGEQDRDRWDGAAVAQARALLATTGREPPGPRQVEAAIALLHATGDPVDWTGVAELYDVLLRLAPSRAVEVNRAVAVGRARGAPAGLAALAPALADARLAGWPALHAAHADLLDRAGDRPAARTAWRRAAASAANPAQREHLLRRAGDVAPSPDDVRLG